MDIFLDRTSLIPLTEQLTTQIKLLVSRKTLMPEDLLPTVKELSSSLNLNYNTVAAAYRALEREGYLTQNRRAGTRVAPKPPEHPKQDLALNLISQLSRQLEALELDTNDLLKLLATQRYSCSQQKTYQVAVLAKTPLEATRVAEQAQILLGKQVTCVPETLHTYASSTYHLTIVDPKLVPTWTTTANVIPLDTMIYSHDFPAGAD